MTSTLETPASAAENPQPAAASPRRQSGTLRPAGQLGELAPRPAPANWRGCGYRRAWTTANGGRAA